MITPGTIKNFRYAPGLRKCVNGLVKGLMVVLLLFVVLAASVILFASILPALFGLKTLVVTSGSMEPTIRTGDALLIRPMSDGSSITVGDIITYRSDHNEETITHRVKAVKQIQGETYYQTQGDANATPDPDLIATQSVVGKTVITLPKLGTFFYYVTPWGKPLLVVASSLIIASWALSLIARDFRRPEASEDIAL